MHCRLIAVAVSQFVTLMAHKMGKEKDTKEMRDAFKLFDDDNSGYINAEEMQRM